MSTHVLLSISKDKDRSADQKPDEVLVFRTDLFTERDLEKIRPKLDQFIGRGSWNVDLPDTDHVLRVKAISRQAQEISRWMQQIGYFCEELPD